MFDRDAAVETMALAFHDDPLHEWIFEDHLARARQLRRWWGWLVDNRPGHAEILTAADHRAIAVWYGPDPVDSPHSRLPDLLVELLGADVAQRKLEGLAVIPASHPADRHWYLGAVGTRPDSQGQGLGQQVVRPVLDRCDTTGTPAYLESTNPRNVAFYERLGFVVSGEIRIPDGPALTPMWREPS